MAQNNAGHKVIVLGGGCFWCLEAIYQSLQGVINVEPGYAGGTVANPTYYQVCNSNTGHAEVVQITYDEKIISTETILKVFFVMHDPTTLNRQGNDVGTQYRSVILFTEPEQEQSVRQVISKFTAEKLFSNPIVTEVKQLDHFYHAEPEHLDYYRQHPESLYCQAIISPKLGKLRVEFANLIKKL